MFRETDTDIQMSLFDNPADLMGKRAAKKYDDPKAWFNQFFGDTCKLPWHNVT